MNVWERKPKFQSTSSKEDEKLFSDEWSEFNLIDVCDLVSTGDTLHPDQLTQIDTAQQAMVEVGSGARFSTQEKDIYVAFVNSLPMVFVRDYRKHEMVRRVEVGHYVTCMWTQGSTIFLGTSDRLVLVLDNDQVKDTLVGHSDEVTSLVSVPEALVSCSGVEIIKWQVRT